MKKNEIEFANEEILIHCSCAMSFNIKDLPIDLTNDDFISPIIFSLKKQINYVIEDDGVYVFRLLVTKIK